MAAANLVRSRTRLTKFFQVFARMARFGIGFLSAALVLVLVCIGGLKLVQYEADSIVPLVATSPARTFFYKDPGHHKTSRNRAGKLVPANRQWHWSNGTFEFFYGLGVVIVLFGVLIATYPMSSSTSALGSVIRIQMTLTTLSFLLTTPEAWIPALGGQNHGFPYLSVYEGSLSKMQSCSARLW